MEAINKLNLGNKFAWTIQAECLDEGKFTTVELLIVADSAVEAAAELAEHLFPTSGVVLDEIISITRFGRLFV